MPESEEGTDLYQYIFRQKFESTFLVPVGKTKNNQNQIKVYVVR